MDLCCQGHAVLCYRWCVSLRDQVSYQSNTLEYHHDFRPWCALQLKRMDCLFCKLNHNNASYFLLVCKLIYFWTCKVLLCCVSPHSIIATVEEVMSFSTKYASLYVLTICDCYAAVQRSQTLVYPVESVYYWISE